ncbi:MAG: F0F1 ATP synthase subunit delta [Myxococcales bacterium]|nr:F0F1 ATP synthase subunit delta [Myxococcales bacterium]
MALDLTTLAFETINFLVLAALLWRLVYRPLRRAIDARRAAIAEDLEHARSAREAAEAHELEWRDREAELIELRERIRAEAIDEAEAERARILARAREDADAERARVTQLLETERSAAAKWVRSAVWSRGTDLAGRLARELVPEALDDALFRRLLPVVEVHLAGLEGSDGEVELTGARLAATEQTEALRAVVAATLGRVPRMTVREDAELLAGWTVRIGDLVLDASLAGELEAFRELARQLDADGEAA